MRKIGYLFSLGGLLFGLSACPPLEDEIQFSAYQPILMNRVELEKSVSIRPARPISNPGKLYLYGDFILINELYKGIHVIDNRNPAQPQNLSFIQAPGNVDFAVKENVLYLDNAVDLVALDISDWQNVNITKRVPATFPPLLAPDNLSSNYPLSKEVQDAVIIGWELKKK